MDFFFFPGCKIIVIAEKAAAVTALVHHRSVRRRVVRESAGLGPAAREPGREPEEPPASLSASRGHSFLRDARRAGRASAPQASCSAPLGAFARRPSSGAGFWFGVSLPAPQQDLIFTFLSCLKKFPLIPSAFGSVDVIWFVGSQIPTWGKKKKVEQSLFQPKVSTRMSSFPRALGEGSDLYFLTDTYSLAFCEGRAVFLSCGH